MVLRPTPSVRPICRAPWRSRNNCRNCRMVSSLLAAINAFLVDRGGLMTESLTRKKRR
jgi:hypothetical protein